MSNAKQLIWVGAAMDPSGYGEATRNYVTRLGRCQDLAVHLNVRYFWGGDVPDLGEQLDDLDRLTQTEVDPAQPHICIQHLTPDNWSLFAPKTIWHIGVTTFETDRLPAHWHLGMRAMDELWTFSHWAAEVFRDQGVRRPITVIPHGADTDQFTPDGPCLLDPKDLDPRPFIFGANFDWSERKNPAALLRAYFSAFKPDDPVMLVIKSYYQGPTGRGHIRAYVDRIKKGMGLTSTPTLVLMPDIVPAATLPAFYRSLDAYVLPSRGEGWGLTFSEAMATGLPTIGVNWSGNTEFMNDGNSLLVKNYKLVEITPAQADHQPQYIGHKWADCDIDELAAHMRTLFDDKDRGRRLGQAARADMVQRFSWDRAAAAAKARLDVLFSGV